jgi:hypothetical protein
MTDREVMQMALDWFHWFQHGTNPNGAHVLEVEEAIRTRLAQPKPLPYWEPCNPGCDPEFNGQRSTHCAELCDHAREALAAQPEPEGYRWEEGRTPPSVTYTVPPKKEWVGLTDDEYEAMAEQYVTNCYFDTLEYAKAIEAKLKEKNT